MLLSNMDIRFWDTNEKRLFIGQELHEIMCELDPLNLLTYGEFSVATGILSQDGTMVYEGDIVSADIPVGPGLMYDTFEFTVEYKNGKFNIDEYCEDIIILGNKYEEIK